MNWPNLTSKLVLLLPGESEPFSRYRDNARSGRHASTLTSPPRRRAPTTGLGEHFTPALLEYQVLQVAGVFSGTHPAMGAAH